MNFYQKNEAAVPAYPTKYDDCTLKATGKPYRFQKGSGRSEILNNWGREGMTMKELIALAAEAGFDPVFTVGAVFRQHDTPEGAWRIEPPEGKTLDDIKGMRAERTLSPEQQAKREARAQEAEAKKQAREARKLEIEAARKLKEEEKAASAQARAAARAEAATAPAPEGAVTADEVKAGRSRRKGKPAGSAAPEGEVLGTAADGVVA